MSRGFQGNVQILFDLYNSVITRVFMFIYNVKVNLLLYIRIAFIYNGEISFNIYRMLYKIMYSADITTPRLRSRIKRIFLWVYMIVIMQEKI